MTVTTIEQLDDALRSPNVKAFLRTLRYCEGTLGWNGYSLLFGGSTFVGFAAHPNKLVTLRSRGKPLSSTAAGAYQSLFRTWKPLVRKFGFTDFNPVNQDRAAVGLIDGRDALDDVLAGNIRTAVLKCNREWASLPESPYGQPIKTMAKFLAVFTAERAKFQ
jgi:muramidase (phage lysozyme)